MKVLQLCKKFPFPMKDGEAIAITYLAKALHSLGAEVTLLAMNTSKHRADLRLLPENFDHYRAIHTVEVDNRVRPGAALLNLFSEESFHISRFVSREFEEKLVKVLAAGDFDVVQLETVYLAPYVEAIRKHSNALVVLRSHNVEHEIWERIAGNSAFFPKKKYLQHLANKLRRFEAASLNSYDLLLSISEGDLRVFEKMGLQRPSLTVPIGLDCGDYRPDFGSFERAVSLSFIGSLDWMPNVEGLRWFLDEVWQPLISKKHPELAFHIAGRNTPRWLRTLGWPNVVVHGEVASAAAFINQHSVMVVPLLSGSGMRAKILEGMALGKAVVSTRLGIEGILVEKNREAFVADTPEEWAAAIDNCLSRGPKLAEVGRRARLFVEKNFDNRAVGAAAVRAYADCLQARKQAVLEKN